MTKARLFLILVTAATILFLLGARLLVLEHPEHADTIVVLAGETYERPERGVQLLQAGYAAKLVLDEPIHQRVFNWTVPELAQRWINTLPQAPRMSVCPISGWSTKQEAHEAAECLQRVNAHNVLLVTSDFHTRRAFSIFTHELSGYHFSIAASHNPTRFGFAWWQHREWAKTTLYEWIRLLWWELVDRWH
ncbi:MAG: YdcF family protein [Acidobacteria bacterium]|nr:YdcF family protein [Acidobacteriota bacterium]